jgi:hypothetical protein
MVYYKIVRVLKNGDRVSAYVNRKPFQTAYIHNGKVRPVDGAFTYADLKEARVELDSCQYGRGNNVYELWECTGLTPIKITRIIDPSYFRNELSFRFPKRIRLLARAFLMEQPVLVPPELQDKYMFLRRKESFILLHQVKLTKKIQ